MRKPFTVILALLMGVTSMNALVKNGSCGANLTWTLNTLDSTLVISGSGAMSYGTYNQYPGWQNYKSYIAYITLPHGLTSIAEEAFSYCSNVTKLIIPDNVVTIGDNAIRYCGIDSLVIPDKVRNIGYGAFKDCSDLVSVKIGAKVKSIRGSAFANCTSLPSVEIPEGVTSIRTSAFEGCTGLKSVIIPNSVDTIDLGAFYCCGLTTVINYSATPQPLDGRAFMYVNKSACTLYVPANSINAYSVATEWEDFFRILSIDEIPTAIEQVSEETESSIHKLLKDGKVLIERDGKVYTLQGSVLK